MEQHDSEKENGEEQVVNGNEDDVKSEDVACSNMDNVTKDLSKLGLNEPPPSITLTEKRMLKKDWKTVKVSIQTIGVITFINLFEAHRDVHEAFKAFRNTKASELRQNQQLRKHALLVMNIVDTCISNLDDKDKVKERLTELGQRHASFKTVRVEFMDLMGPEAIEAIKPHLEGVWDRDHESAWRNLFKLIAYHLKRGIAGV